MSSANREKKTRKISCENRQDRFCSVLQIDASALCAAAHVATGESPRGPLPLRLARGVDTVIADDTVIVDKVLIRREQEDHGDDVPSFSHDGDR